MVMMAVTSRKWWQATKQSDQATAIGKRTVFFAGFVVAVSYTQLVLGAQLRHVQPDAPPSRFTLIVALHVVTAFLLWTMTAALWRAARRCGDLTLSRPASSLIGLVGVQILLGLGTWVVNYGWPGFLLWAPGATGFLLRSKGFADSVIVTAHVATGALILGVAALELVRLLRVRWCRMHSQISPS
jgi:cytochrome c oxidase assembly protein subunit 15